MSVVSNSVQPHRRQPTRLPSLGFSSKNTRVGCHFLLQCMKVKSEGEVAQSCPTLRDSMDCSLPGSSILRKYQKTGEGVRLRITGEMVGINTSKVQWGQIITGLLSQMKKFLFYYISKGINQSFHNTL